MCKSPLRRTVLVALATLAVASCSTDDSGAEGGASGADAGSDAAAASDVPGGVDTSGQNSDGGVVVPSDITSRADGGGVAECPAPPAGISEDAREAIDLVNSLRVAMGAPCATMHETLNLAAERHCRYYTSSTGDCQASNPHQEVEGCELFQGVNFGTRVSAAGYEGGGAFEDMHFVGDGTRAVQGWVDSVWHRTPVLSPWIGDLGYGNAPGCDTMDFGRGTGAAADLVAQYPYAGQTDVPASFSGNEGPAPPAPETGWPSGYPIHVYARGATITTHILTTSNDETEIDHVWVSPADSNLISNEHILYANDGLAAQTTYRVQITGTYEGGPLTLDWTFTTR